MVEVCVVCRTRPGRVCHTCQTTIDNQLAGLPARYARLADVLTPGRAPIGEHVGSGGGSVHAASPVRDAALSLLGPGADVPPALHPLARHWSAKRTVQATTHANGYAQVVEVEVTDWFHDLVVDEDGQPMLAAHIDDDQVGVVPPREWLDMQARSWRAHFGHHVPARTLAGDHPYVPAAYATLLRTDRGAGAIAFLVATHIAGGGPARLLHHGLTRSDHAHPAPGEPPRSMRWDVSYLRTWLDKACGDDDVDMAAFAAELRALYAELDRALGEVQERSRIGRCPAFLAEVDADGQPTGRKRPCGGALWEERGAYLSAQVVCPRCRMTWETRGHAGAGTAREIRRVWPVDRWRRYTREQISRIVLPKCPGCGKRVVVEWRDVTGTRDPERTWQARSARCRDGCEQARRVM